MTIYINDKEYEVSAEKPLIEALNDNGFETPSLCYANGAKHQASCMVCMVKNLANGQMIPSCSTFPTEGMRIETDSEEVLTFRRTSLELLLSDHRADCEAPCTIVCPNGLDPAQILLYYDRGQMEEAKSLLMKQCEKQSADSSETIFLPCEGCKTPCEKACRRGTVDQRVEISDIMKKLYADDTISSNNDNAKSIAIKDKTSFFSRITKYSDLEKEWLKEEYKTKSTCLHCACEGREKCKLRKFATKAGIKTPRFGVSSALPVKIQEQVGSRLCFEPAKCVRCGLCVYNSEDGFTFKNRGFVMQVVIPEESKKNVGEELARLCPTGAIFIKEK